MSKNLTIPCQPLTSEDRKLLAEVDKSLALGIELYEWFKATLANDGFTDRFRLVSTFRPGDDFGFFDQAPIGGAMRPVMGEAEEILYYTPKGTRAERRQAARKLRDQVQEFVLGNFMRIADFRQPQAFVSPDEERRPLPPPLNCANFCPSGEAEFEGWGYSQLFYKLRSSGQVCRVPESQRYEIVDVREIGTTLDWLVCNVDVFNFGLELEPCGEDQVTFKVALPGLVSVVLSKEFIINEEDPAKLEDGAIGRYGFGYATLKTPGPSLLAFGPGEFEFGFENFVFTVFDDGRVKASGAFAVNRPDRIVNVSLDPLTWGCQMANVMTRGLSSPLCSALEQLADRLPIPRPGNVDPIFGSIRLLNLMTGGQAGKQLCISVRDLLVFFLVVHFQQRYSMITGTLLTWSEVPDWLATERIPERVLRGIVRRLPDVTPRIPGTH